MLRRTGFYVSLSIPIELNLYSLGLSARGTLDFLTMTVNPLRQMLIGNKKSDFKAEVIFNEDLLSNIVMIERVGSWLVSYMWPNETCLLHRCSPKLYWPEDCSIYKADRINYMKNRGSCTRAEC